MNTKSKSAGKSKSPRKASAKSTVAKAKSSAKKTVSKAKNEVEKAGAKAKAAVKKAGKAIKQKAKAVARDTEKLSHGKDMYLIPVKGEIHPARINERKQFEKNFKHNAEVAMHQEQQKVKAILSRSNNMRRTMPK